MIRLEGHTQERINFSEGSPLFFRISILKIYPKTIDRSENIFTCKFQRI